MDPRVSVTELVGRHAQTSRVQLPYGTATWVGLATHVGLLGLFVYFDVRPMAILNIFSIAIFVLVRWMFATNRIQPAMRLAISEVVVHQVLAVWFCGWEPGFQYYLLCIAPLCQMLPGISFRRRTFYTAIPVATFVMLSALAGQAYPAYPFPEPFQTWLGTTNMLVSFAVLWVFVDFYRRGAERAEGMLAAAWERTEQLVRQMLPPKIVEQLREKPGVVADRFESTTVLFVDLVGFTTLAARKEPEELVVMLDEIFASFDDLVKARGLEKIKTIGDAYMVAAGVPEPRADHAAAAADLALAMCDRVAEHAARLDEDLQIRVGIHTGPVVAGVIGKTKFAYDLWGDAVNTASRMESHGTPGRIHVSATTADALSGDFELEPRGAIDVKGKGEMETFWLVGRKPADSAAAADAPMTRAG